MKNIAIIITKLNGGGAERCASNLSIELNKYFNVHLIVFDGRNISYPYGGELFDLQIVNSKSICGKIINVLKRVKKIKEIKKKYRIECSISLLDGPNIVNVLSHDDDKIIVSVRNHLSSEKMGKLRKKLVTYSSEKANLTISLSDMVKRDLIDQFGIQEEKIKTIYNHCDANLLRELVEGMPAPSYYRKECVYFCIMGRLTVQKGQWHAIRVFSKIVQEIPNARLVVMGEGDLEANLKQLAKELAVEDKIIFTGYIKNPHNIFKYCEMFIFPSLFEGLGNVLLEAMAFGLPIISTDCKAGPREILAPQTDLNKEISLYEVAEYGILTPVMDLEHFNSNDPLTLEEQELYKAIIRLHNDSELRELFRAKSKECLKQFEIEKIVGEWKECICG